MFRQLEIALTQSHLLLTPLVHQPRLPVRQEFRSCENTRADFGLLTDICTAKNFLAFSEENLRAATSYELAACKVRDNLLEDQGLLCATVPS